MGSNSFAPLYQDIQCFIVLNKTPDKRTIHIFHYPINYNCTRNLLSIEGVAESDIRASLLKGELRNRLLNKEILVICSDIDLLQFNNTQKAFLMSSGIVKGLEVGSDQITQELSDRIDGDGTGGITANEHEKILQLIHYIDSGATHPIFNNTIRITTPSGSPFPTSITWFLDDTQTTKLVEKTITYNVNKTPNTIMWKMYDKTGLVVTRTVVDTFIYTNGVFESKRIRAII